MPCWRTDSAALLQRARSSLILLQGTIRRFMISDFGKLWNEISKDILSLFCENIHKLGCPSDVDSASWFNSLSEEEKYIVGSNVLDMFDDKSDNRTI